MFMLWIAPASKLESAVVPVLSDGLPGGVLPLLDGEAVPLAWFDPLD